MTGDDVEAVAKFLDDKRATAVDHASAVVLSWDDAQGFSLVLHAAAKRLADLSAYHEPDTTQMADDVLSGKRSIESVLAELSPAASPIVRDEPPAPSNPLCWGVVGRHPESPASNPALDLDLTFFSQATAAAHARGLNESRTALGPYRVIPLVDGSAVVAPVVESTGGSIGWVAGPVASPSGVGATTDAALDEIRAFRADVGRGTWTDINLVKALVHIDTLMAREAALARFADVAATNSEALAALTQTPIRSLADAVLCYLEGRPAIVDRIGAEIQQKRRDYVKELLAELQSEVIADHLAPVRDALGLTDRDSDPADIITELESRAASPVSAEASRTTLAPVETTKAERLAAFDAIGQQQPFEHAHRVDVCIRAIRSLAACPLEVIVCRVRDPNDVAFWQQVALTYERTLIGVEERNENVPALPPSESVEILHNMLQEYVTDEDRDVFNAILANFASANAALAAER